jgi:hypothetical protein
MSLNPDGSEDHEIKIKGLDSIQVGDYTQEQLDHKSGLESLSLEDIEKIQASQALIDSLLPSLTSSTSAILLLSMTPAETLTYELDEDLDREEDREELQTLGRMVTHERRINRYFTADEGDRVEDPNDITTDSENDTDSNQRFDSSDKAFDTERDRDQEDEDENM